MEQAGLFRWILLLLCLCMVAGVVSAYESAAVQELSKSNPAKYNEYLSLMKKGDSLMQGSMYSEANEIYQQAKEIVPRDSAVLASIGRAYRMKGYDNYAQDYCLQAETQAKQDYQSGSIPDKDFNYFMSELSNEQIRLSENELRNCRGNTYCEEKAQEKIDMYKNERTAYMEKARKGNGIPFPLFTVFMGLCVGAFLVARRRK